MIRPPPRSTRTDTLFPYTTLFRSRLLCLLDVVSSWRLRSVDRAGARLACYVRFSSDARRCVGGRPRLCSLWRCLHRSFARLALARGAHPSGPLVRDRGRDLPYRRGDSSVRVIGRAHVCTPITNAHLVCRLL